MAAANKFGSPLGPIGSASAAVIISTGGASGFGLYRSGDGGRTWMKVLPVSGNGDVHTPVFTTTTTGYWLAPNDSTLWTTHNTGRTWTATNFA